jgi:3',5'-cyclic AMP phosphodiesterase CpdA
MALLSAMTKIHMNLLHLSDMHFGPRHWLGNNKKLLEKINSYDVDIVLNTGDSTTDALESEFEEAGQFLQGIDCTNVISIPGNHDKRNMRSADYFRQYIDNVEVIRPLNRDNCRKHHLYLDSHTTGISDQFTDINFLKKITVNSEAILVVCLDSNELYKDTGFVDKEILKAVSERIRSEVYDRIVLLNHHSILDTDSDPLFNSKIVIEFVREHKINHVFCGHTHQLSIMKSTDLYHGHSFVQYKNGSLSSANTPNDTNMFIYYSDFGTETMKIHIIRSEIKGGDLNFREEIVAL